MCANIKKINIFILLIIVNLPLFAQDAVISQPQYNLFLTNPAFVGTYDGGRISSFYRQQWLLLDHPYAQYGVSYDQSVNKYNSGIGVYLYNNVEGIFISPTINFAYAYKVEIDKNTMISLALQAGITQKYISNKELTFPDELETGIDSGEEIKRGFNKIYPDFGFGAVLFYKNLDVGLSVCHLNQPLTSRNDIKGSQLKMKLTGQIGYAIELKKRTRSSRKHYLMPYLIANMQGLQTNFMWGTSMRYDYILTGLFARNDLSNIDAIILYAGFEKKKFRCVYSYDMNIGKQTTKILGSHEITLMFLFNIKQKKKMKAISCPHFAN